ncbi:MAG: hypothetical protein AAGF46_04770 [Pseudomonadota bacterium]
MNGRPMPSILWLKNLLLEQKQISISVRVMSTVGFLLMWGLLGIGIAAALVGMLGLQTKGGLLSISVAGSLGLTFVVARFKELKKIVLALWHWVRAAQPLNFVECGLDTMQFAAVAALAFWLSGPRPELLSDFRLFEVNSVVEIDYEELAESIDSRVGGKLDELIEATRGKGAVEIHPQVIPLTFPVWFEPGVPTAVQAEEGPEQWISPPQQDLLNQAVAAIRACATERSNVRVLLHGLASTGDFSGHVDRTVNLRMNQELAARRAAVVEHYLATAFGPEWVTGANNSPVQLINLNEGASAYLPGSRILDDTAGATVHPDSGTNGDNDRSPGLFNRSVFVGFEFAGVCERRSTVLMTRGSD